MLTIKELSIAVHENSVAHGWWDSERSVEETIALIHSEFSEALEEYRAGRPMVWYACLEDPKGQEVCAPKDESECTMFGHESECKYKGHKPEGIAVELIDGVIRILDYIGRHEVCNSDYETLDALVSDVPRQHVTVDLPILVTGLHLYTSISYHALSNGSDESKNKLQVHFAYLYQVMGVACAWLAANGIDYYSVLIEKHEYNKTRSYKHGNKIC